MISPRHMKPRHWFNLIFVALTACLVTFVLFQWAKTGYVEPTCRNYAASNNMSYVGYIPTDASQTSGSSHLSRDGSCQLRRANGTLREVSLVTASGSRTGPPFLVSMALAWEMVLFGSFMLIALVLAGVIRMVTGKAPN